MVVNYDCLGADYRRIESRFERWAVHKVLGLLFGKIPVELDFLDGDIRQMRHNSPSISVAPPRFWRLVLILRNPNLYFAQAFVDGHWFCVRGSLAELVLQLRNRKKKNTRNSGFSTDIGEMCRHVYKQYIQLPKIHELKKHYNEDFRIYEQVIGKSLVYSCAFFEDFSSDLSTAQENKLKIILDRIGGEGTKDNNTLDIGCGWGSFIFYAAHQSLGTFDGISLAQSQINFANEQTKSLSSDVSSRIQFFNEEFDGFRDGEVDIYDRVVSIGMLEHVGKTHYRRFFSEVNRLLKPKGRGLFHTITRNNTGITNAWIDEHVFPGGHIPRPSEIVAGIEASGLNLVAYHRHDGTNYKRTLECWLKNLIHNELACLEILRENIEAATSQSSKTLGRQKISYQSRCGFRIWYFFLASTQCIFDRRGGAFDVTQFIVTKPSPEAY